MATSGWKQWSTAEARGALKAWRSSGQPLATYAREQGISEQRWRGRVGEPSGGGGAAPLATIIAPVRVVVREAPLIEVVLRGGQVVRVRCGFSRELLVDVVRALEGTC